jgi:hypothetical protein
MLGTLGSLKRIAEEMKQHGTWRSIEDTFYGFAEAEALLAHEPGRFVEAISRSGAFVDIS